MIARSLNARLERVNLFAPGPRSTLEALAAAREELPLDAIRDRLPRAPDRSNLTAWLDRAWHDGLVSKRGRYRSSSYRILEGPYRDWLSRTAIGTAFRTAFPPVSSERAFVSPCEAKAAAAVGPSPYTERGTAIPRVQAIEETLRTIGILLTGRENDGTEGKPQMGLPYPPVTLSAEDDALAEWLVATQAKKNPRAFRAKVRWLIANDAKFAEDARRDHQASKPKLLAPPPLSASEREGRRQKELLEKARAFVGEAEVSRYEAECFEKAKESHPGPFVGMNEFRIRSEAQSSLEVTLLTLYYDHLAATGQEQRIIDEWVSVGRPIGKVS